MIRPSNKVFINTVAKSWHAFYFKGGILLTLDVLDIFDISLQDDFFLTVLGPLTVLPNSHNFSLPLY